MPNQSYKGTKSNGLGNHPPNYVRHPWSDGLPTYPKPVDPNQRKKHKMTITESNKKNDNGLSDMVRNIARTIEEGKYETESEEGCNAYDYLSSALDFRWIVQNDLTFIGARILVAFGGPNVWIDTDKKKVEGFWWGDYASANYSEDSLGLEECVEELYQMRLDEARRKKN